MTDAQLQAMLREMAARDEREEPSDRVERAVMSRWAERHAASAGGRRPEGRFAHGATGASRYVAAGVGLAAALLLVAWVAQRRPALDSPAARESEATITMQSEPDAVPVTPPVEEAARPMPVQARAVSRRPSVAAAEERGGVDRVWAFASLQPLTEQELFGIRVARVRLSGQAAERLGLPAPGLVLGPDGSIEADVLLGEDGMARAIRFVR